MYQQQNAQQGPQQAPRVAAYPLNADGLPEFASVTVTLDHLLTRDPRHVIQKMVFSTQSVEESLAGLFDYYGDGRAAMSMGSNLDLLVKGRSDPEHTAYLYAAPVQTRDRMGGIIVQVVMSTAAMGHLVNHKEGGKGSSLLAVNLLVELASNALASAKAQLGAFPALSLVELAYEALPQNNMPGQSG